MKMRVVNATLLALCAILFLLTLATRGRTQTVSLHIDSRSLWPLERLSASKIDNIGDATVYVSKAATLCGIAAPDLLPENLESRIAKAELDVAKDPSRLISDDQVAEAFNFMSDEFHVPTPTRLTGADALHYRGVMSAFLPHVFSPKSVSGNRPVGALVMLYMLVYYGGMTEGWKKAGGPGGYGITEADPDHPVPGTGKTSTLIATEYQTAANSYFLQRSPDEAHAFLNRMAKILTLPSGRQ
jgi:hypothetical protein